ncbi:uracil-DNA glycosylase [Williamsia sp. CHRR-6]|uniref:uracil-DNA glycosylase n=1 Tax=Williamsia sp. CHRR-6 TaxID=2835871 RepID=UPI001BDAB053|nr:uracil-DNA glycosylase [Williamsia sp. CHRR-6]MBT0565835.1 uracil-DNA glycosylase [Williamsia sp. CHRR-6]
MSARSDLAALDTAVCECRACPRLVAWREQVAREKKRAYADHIYWGRGVPGFGPATARLLIVGLAPAAHGANRTGRMFTGDRSGDVLFAALHAVGLANQPNSDSVGDGMALHDVRITAPVHCAPPANAPTPAERDACAHWLQSELTILAPRLRAVVALGAFGWQAALTALQTHGRVIGVPRPRFGHGKHVDLPYADRPRARPLRLYGSYHVSQQNTFTGRLTPAMLESVLADAAEFAGIRAG